MKVKNAKGEDIPGELSEDGKTWLPNQKLAYDTAYTAEFTGTGADGKTGTTTGTFTTMKTPKNWTRTVSFMGEGAVVGVGMPLMLSFSEAIPENYRAEVERHLTVTADPPQEGSWGWLSPTSIQYRPKEYWKAGTKINYRVDHAGVKKMGNGWWGKTDYDVNVTIGSQLIMEVDNKTKHMTVIKDGQKVKNIPVSLGQPKFPSVSGTMLVMEKLRKTVFDTYGQFSDDDATASTSSTPSASPGAASSSTRPPGPTPPRAGRTSRTAASTSARRPASGSSSRPSSATRSSSRTPASPWSTATAGPSGT